MLKSYLDFLDFEEVFLLVLEELFFKVVVFNEEVFTVVLLLLFV